LFNHGVSVLHFRIKFGQFMDYLIFGIPFNHNISPSQRRSSAVAQGLPGREASHAVRDTSCSALLAPRESARKA
jgi:hypothetical protein